MPRIADATLRASSTRTEMPALASQSAAALPVMPDPYTYRGQTDNVYAVGWSSDGNLIASGSEDSTVQVWSIS